jgi:hypothetical protein
MIMYYAAPLGLTGWLVACAAALAVTLGAVLYTVLWKRRFRFGVCLLRVRGVIVGPGDKGRPVIMVEPSGAHWNLPPFMLATGDGPPLKVITRDADLSCRRTARYRGRRVRWLQVGDALTAEGTLVPHACPESGYREQAADLHFEAARVVRGAWPELRWLRWVLLASLAAATTAGVVILGGERYELRLDWLPPDTPVAPKDRSGRHGPTMDAVIPATNCVMVSGVLRPPPACAALLPTVEKKPESVIHSPRRDHETARRHPRLRPVRLLR